MQIQPVIIYDTVKLFIKVNFLKISSDIIRCVEITVVTLNLLILVFIMLLVFIMFYPFRTAQCS